MVEISTLAEISTESSKLKVSEKAKIDTLGQNIRLFRDIEGYTYNMMGNPEIDLCSHFLINRTWKSAESADLLKNEKYDFLAIFSSFLLINSA